MCVCFIGFINIFYPTRCISSVRTISRVRVKLLYTVNIYALKQLKIIGLKSLKSWIVLHSK